MPSDHLFFASVCGLISFLACYYIMPSILNWLKENKILDKPVERSSHTTPTPRGGGWAILPICLVGILSLFVSYGVEWPLYLLILLTAVLMWISWQDDINPVAPGLRFVIQAACVGVGIMLLPNGYVFQGHLPFWFDRALSFWALLWFVNLYNFMDGIDGLTAVQTIFIGLGVALLLLLRVDGEALWPAYGFIIAGSALAFLIWNWHPAKIFIGDVGAVPLGFLLGWYLFYLATQGYIWAACIIPLYYCFDATVTLARRLKAGHAPWEPHRMFFFQAPIPHLFNHAQVVWRIILINIFLFICAFLVARSTVFLFQLPAILASGFACIGLLFYFESKRETKKPSPVKSKKAGTKKTTKKNTK